MALINTVLFIVLGNQISFTMFVCVCVCVCVCVSLALTKAARHYCSESPLAFPWAEVSKGLMVG